ncbi:MAG: serine hydrolase [Anaerolineae bacterium]|nr:serine hydrolase [Anaerolineae bacterium]
MDWLAEMCEAFDGRVGVSALNLQTSEQLLYHADEVFPTASAIKLAVLAAMMQQVEDGLFSLETPLMLRRADQISGSGLLQFLTPGVVMPLRDWAFLMMNISDNLATNVLIDQVGLAAVQNWLAENGYPDVQLHRKIDFGVLAQDITQLGTATPAGLNRLMTAVFRHEILTPTACNEMLRMMDKVGSERVGRYLPFAFYGDETPEEEKLRLAGKTGSLKGCRVQTAVVWRGVGENRRGFSITVMADGDPAPELWSADAAGVLLIGRIARAVYDRVFIADRL